MSKKHYHLQLEQFPLPCLRISRVEFQQVLGPRRFDKTLTARGTSQATAACWAWISQLMAIQVSPGRERRWCRGCSSRVSWQFVGACKIDSLMSMGWPTQQKKNGGDCGESILIALSLPGELRLVPGCSSVGCGHMCLGGQTGLMYLFTKENEKPWDAKAAYQNAYIV